MTMSMCYTDRYTSSFNLIVNTKVTDIIEPSEYYLGSTPLNEALVVLNKMIPIFKDRNRIEKMSLITLTDGGSSNSSFNDKMMDTSNGLDDLYGL